MITFINPWAFIWLLLAIPILILYAFRQRRYIHKTGAGELWKDSISFLDPRFWWNPWRRLVSLLVQLAILLTFVVAMAEPCFRPPQRLAVIIDCTESMRDALAAGDQSAVGSEVREKLAQMVENLGYHDRIALIAAESPARILCRTTSDKEKILSALDEYLKEPQLTQNAQAMNQAIDVARALVAKKAGEKELDPRTQNIVLISDGRFPEFEQTAQTPGVHWLPVGKSFDNFALLSVGARCVQDGKIAVLCTLANYSSKSQTGTIDVAGTEQEISAKPDEKLSTIIEIDASAVTDAGQIDVVWKPSVGKERKLALPAIHSVNFNAYLVSRGNPALEDALKAVPAIDKVESLKKLPTDLPDNAIVVFDEASPAELPNAYTICIAPKKTSNLWTATETPVDAVVESVNVDFFPGLWTNCNLIGQQFRAAASIEPTSPAVTLASDKNGSALAWAVDGEKKAQHFVFACQQWQTVPGFGIVVKNIVDFWSNGEFDPYVTEEFLDEDGRMPTSSVDAFSLPGEDVIPLWTILGVILLIAVCVEWCLYQRRWLE